ncbi:hypothetical protein FB107DRAFT_252548 [Schizophyllum commune]
MTIYRVMRWANKGNPMKTDEQIDAMVTEIVQAPDFDPSHLDNFSCARENARLTRAMAEAQDAKDARAFLRQYTSEKVVIDVPTGRAGESVPYEIPGLLHTSLTRIIKAAFEDSLAQHLHYTPFELRHSASGDVKNSQRVHGELYTSPALLEAHNDIQFHASLPPDDPKCTRERLVIALQLASDATHLADFGNAKAWPIYVMLGNISKYILLHPCLLDLPPSFAAFGEANHSKWKTQHKDVSKHCHRELMHAVWSKILDAEFLHAYKYGMVVRCLDGVERRIYPRIFTYSADYPEKVLLATIRDGGLCPCPWCLVEKSKLDRLGLRRDMATRISKARRVLADYVTWARNAIYKFAHPIGGKVVEMILKPYSAVPTVNAFSDKLGPNFNPSDMFVVDLMHEFELGVWKAFFTHLIRILYAADPLVTTLNERYRQIESFGRGTMPQRNLLQCALPCFDGLLDDEAFNRKLRCLLYRTAEWHATAKLRMHTDTTLDFLDELTREFGALAREFEQLSAAQFATVATPKEATARARREMNRTAAAAGKPKPSADDVEKAPKSRKPKRLNFSTYKFHSLGDYSSTIRRYGTTDSYITQTSELAHRVVKRLYELTNKKEAMQQVADKNARSEFFHEMEKHEIRISRTHPPIGFIDNLKDHLLGRCLHREFDGDDYDFSDEDRSTIQIKDDTIYWSQIPRANYTTYDVRRDYDCISARRQDFLMTRSPEESADAHPYWYAQVLGVYRADVRHTGLLSRDIRYHQMDFLFVRWLGSEAGYRWGRRFAHLPKVGYVVEAQPDAFRFSTQPFFVDGRGVPCLRRGSSLARADGQDDDWINHYVNIFVDRDMSIRHLGGGNGHLAPSEHLAATSSGDVDSPEDEDMANAPEDDPCTARQSDEYLRQIASTTADDEEDAVCKDDQVDDAFPVVEVDVANEFRTLEYIPQLIRAQVKVDILGRQSVFCNRSPEARDAGEAPQSTTVEGLAYEKADFGDCKDAMRHEEGRDGEPAVDECSSIRANRRGGQRGEEIAPSLPGTSSLKPFGSRCSSASGSC